MECSKQISVGLESLIKVERVSLRGPGVLILTGPSSCGKGQVANSICRFLSVDSKYHLSMGEILRNAINQLAGGEFPADLKRKFENHFQRSLRDPTVCDEAFLLKVVENLPGMIKYFKQNLTIETITAQHWLEYCTNNGLLIPNLWTELFLEHHIDNLLTSNKQSTIILDGYPRTVGAAKHLISYFEKIKLPILKVIHLTISREEMLRRAILRGRSDDSEEAIHRRFNFYVEKVHPSVDYLKEMLGSDRIALVDAHQPVYFTDQNGKKVLDVKKSIERICISSLRALGVPRIVIADLILNSEE